MVGSEFGGTESAVWDSKLLKGSESCELALVFKIINPIKKWNCIPRYSPVYKMLDFYLILLY